MRIKKALAAIMISLFLALPSFSLSEEVSGDLFKTGAPVDITADTLTYDKETDTYFAAGDVVIVQETTTLSADSVILNMASGVATAAGNVLLTEAGGTLRGDQLQFNIREKTAVLAKGRLFYKEENVHITGDPIRKTGPQTYDAKKATFTTCDCPEGGSPAWSFAATSAKITVGDFLTGWNARFNIKGVPVLYSPFVSVPIKRERQTGFLQPKPGYSRLRGFVLDNSFFWAIARNMDATFYLDVETARGLGKGAEFRYIRTRRSSGEMSFYHYKEKDIERVREFRQGVDNLSRPQSAGDDRWRFKWGHHELLGEWYVRANVDVVSDDEYFIDFGKGTAERSLESLESNISISRNWSVYSLVGQFRKFNNLLTRDDSEVLQKLPEITFKEANDRILDTPFYVSFDTSFINFARHRGTEGQRLDIQPRLSLPLNPGGYLDLTPSFAPRATYYLVKDDPNGRFADRYLYEARVDATTTFVRITNTGFERLKALRHTIRPGLTYIYVPQAVQDDLPNLDSVDRVPITNSVTYSLNSTLTGKLMENGDKRYFEYMYFDINQTYNIHDATRKLTSDTDRRTPFSDIGAELRVSPNQWATVTGRGKYNVYDNRFNSYDASLSAHDKWGSSLNVAYRFVRDSASYLEANARVHVIRPVDLTYFKRFSFDQYRSLETSYGIEYRHQCWNALLTYTERLEERIVFLTFSLKGLGRVAGIEGKIEPL